MSNSERLLSASGYFCYGSDSSTVSPAGMKVIPVSKDTVDEFFLQGKRRASLLWKILDERTAYSWDVWSFHGKNKFLYEVISNELRHVRLVFRDTSSGEKYSAKLLGTRASIASSLGTYIPYAENPFVDRKYSWNACRFFDAWYNDLSLTQELYDGHLSKIFSYTTAEDRSNYRDFHNYIDAMSHNTFYQFMRYVVNISGGSGDSRLSKEGLTSVYQKMVEVSLRFENFLEITGIDRRSLYLKDILPRDKHMFVNYTYNLIVDMEDFLLSLREKFFSSREEKRSYLNEFFRNCYKNEHKNLLYHLRMKDSDISEKKNFLLKICDTYVSLKEMLHLDEYQQMDFVEECIEKIDGYLSRTVDPERSLSEQWDRFIYLLNDYKEVMHSFDDGWFAIDFYHFGSKNESLEDVYINFVNQTVLEVATEWFIRGEFVNNFSWRPVYYNESINQTLKNFNIGDIPGVGLIFEELYPTFPNESRLPMEVPVNKELSPSELKYYSSKVFQRSILEEAIKEIYGWEKSPYVPNVFFMVDSTEYDHIPSMDNEQIYPQTIARNLNSFFSSDSFINEFYRQTFLTWIESYSTRCYGVVKPLYENDFKNFSYPFLGEWGGLLFRDIQNHIIAIPVVGYHDYSCIGGDETDSDECLFGLNDKDDRNQIRLNKDHTMDLNSTTISGSNISPEGLATGYYYALDGNYCFADTNFPQYIPYNGMNGLYHSGNLDPDNIQFGVNIIYPHDPHKYFQVPDYYETRVCGSCPYFSNLSIDERFLNRVAKAEKLFNRPVFDKTSFFQDKKDRLILEDIHVWYLYSYGIGANS
uniref:Uncharacterized protein n=1 Tax=Pleurostomum flabellatum TaxID=405751 RepID=A0A7T0M400_9EUKA|nr:hypothetical protein J6731_mgp13 [Pleurostomum flabellatum]QPL15588.1 hypothetical protein [Pleurostomum flabellatum]